MLVCILLKAAAVAATCLISSQIWTFYLVMFFSGCVGAGFVANYVRAISDAFLVARGRAIGVMFLAGGVGCSIGPLLTQWAIEKFGWRGGYLVLGAVVLLAWPLAFLWLKERDVTDRSPKDSAALVASSHTRREALRYIIFAWIFSGLAGGAYFFLAPFFNDVGLGQKGAATCLSVMFAAGAVVHPLLGWINDRWYPPFVAAIAFLVEATAFSMLGLFGAEWAMLASALAGIGMSGLSNSLYICLPKYFGVRSFAELAGFILSAGSAAGLLGPLCFSLVYSQSGGYVFPYLLTGAIAVAAAGCMCMAGRTIMKQQTNTSAIRGM